MACFFLSYRVSTASQYAGRLFDRLTSRFGEGAVFYDRGYLRPGEEWQQRILSELKSVTAVLPIIEPGWARTFSMREANLDIMRLELETSLELKKRIIPVFVGDVRPEQECDVPPSLEPILGLQGLAIEDGSVTLYDASVDRLISDLERLAPGRILQEEKILDLLKRGDYSTIVRILAAIPFSERTAAKTRLYSALAQLRGRSFNALYPIELENVELLLRESRRFSPQWAFPLALLAILEIDYYELHGLVSSDPVEASQTVDDSGVLRLTPDERVALLQLSISKRALRRLGLARVHEVT